MAERSKKRLVGSIGGALTLVAIVVFSMMSAGVMAGAFSPGIGGFNAQFDKVYGNNATIYPATVTDTAACSGTDSTGDGDVPVLTAEIQDIKAQGIVFNKTVQAPDQYTLDSIDNVTITIEQNNPNNNISLGNAGLFLSGLDSTYISLSNTSGGQAAIFENYSDGSGDSIYGTTSESPLTTEFRISATSPGAGLDDFYLEGGSAFAHLVTIGQLKATSGLQISLTFNARNKFIANDACGV